MKTDESFSLPVCMHTSWWVGSNNKPHLSVEVELGDDPAAQDPSNPDSSPQVEGEHSEQINQENVLLCPLP